MPYALDLVRLATSTLLAHGKQGAPADAIARAILGGYRRGLEAPSPTVLDRKYRWLRKLVVVSASRRRDFWREDRCRASRCRRPPRYRKVLQASMPKPGLELQHRPPRGRCRQPRSAALDRGRRLERRHGGARGQGGGAVGLVPRARRRRRSHPLRRHRRRPLSRARSLVRGGRRHRRAPPVAQQPQDRGRRSGHADAVSERLLAAMGRELAAVHLGVADRRQAILRDLDKRDGDAWLADSAQRWPRPPARLQGLRRPCAQLSSRNLPQATSSGSASA